MSLGFIKNSAFLLFFIVGVGSSSSFGTKLCPLDKVHSVLFPHAALSESKVGAALNVLKKLAGDEFVTVASQAFETASGKTVRDYSLEADLAEGVAKLADRKELEIDQKAKLSRAIGKFILNHQPYESTDTLRNLNDKNRIVAVKNELNEARSSKASRILRGARQARNLNEGAPWESLQTRLASAQRKGLAELSMDGGYPFLKIEGKNIDMKEKSSRQLIEERDEAFQDSDGWVPEYLGNKGLVVVSGKEKVLKLVEKGKWGLKVPEGAADLMPQIENLMDHPELAKVQGRLKEVINDGRGTGRVLEIDFYFNEAGKSPQNAQHFGSRRPRKEKFYTLKIYQYN